MRRWPSTVTVTVTSLTSVVVAIFDTLGREDLVQVVAGAARPLLHDREHVSMELAVLVAKSWVVEHADDVVENLVHRDIGMLPCVDDARCDILKDGRSYLASWLIENVGEMVFGKQRVRRVGTGRVCPDFVLVTPTSIDNSRRTLL